MDVAGVYKKLKQTAGVVDKDFFVLGSAMQVRILLLLLMQKYGLNWRRLVSKALSLYNPAKFIVAGSRNTQDVAGTYKRD